MSDRLALANAIEDAGIERAKAERIATVVFDALSEHVATRADVEASAASVRADFAELRADTRTDFAELRADFERLRSDVLTDHSEWRGEVAELRGEMRTGFAQVDARIERLDGGLELLRERMVGMENRIMIRVGGLVVAGIAIIVALQHFWR